VKTAFTQSMSIFTVKIMGVFCYFDDFPDDGGVGGPGYICRG
jgi:hypothetical protein